MNHYHVGIVVTDIEEASAHLSEMLGVTWGPVMALPAVDYRDESGCGRQLADDDALFDG